MCANLTGKPGFKARIEPIYGLTIFTLHHIFLVIKVLKVIWILTAFFPFYQDDHTLVQ